MVRALELQFGGPYFKSRSDRLLNLFIKSLAMLVNSQLVYLRPVEILPPVLFRLFVSDQAFALRILSLGRENNIPEKKSDTARKKKTVRLEASSRTADKTSCTQGRRTLAEAAR